MLRSSLVSGAIALSICSIAWQTSAQDVGRLGVNVVLVAADLSLKPVPRKPFRITGVNTELDLVTSFTGAIATSLSPGEYELANPSPVEFEGKSYSWSVRFIVEANHSTSIDLSNDNATVTGMAALPTPGLMNETELYQRHSASVFKIVAEGGHGSGFLVDKRGLIVTNHHVVAQSEYLAVNIDPASKYPAKLVAQDPVNDIAILRVHPDAVQDLAPLAMLGAASSRPIVTGERVLAIGSPLATETILTSGIVSKVERDAIYSDVNINPGNSGGPLFNAYGEVIGINTFGLFSSGPGVSGIVRSHLVEPVVAAARATLDEQSPANARLPVASAFTFPAAALREQALATRIKPTHYHLEMGAFDVTFIDPVVIASLEVESEKVAAATRDRRNRRNAEVSHEEVGSDFYEWRRYGGDYRPVVRIQATPELGMPPGSWIAVGLGATSGLRYWFKADFGRMELLRDGVPVEPLHPGRIRQVVDASLAGNRLADVAYYGAYEYPPAVFEPGAKLVLRVWEHGKRNPIEKTVPADLVSRIWSHFEPYNAAIGAQDL